MRFYIPTIGDTIKLEVDWCFTVHQEERNVSMLEYFGHKDDVDYHIERKKWWNLYGMYGNKQVVEPPDRRVMLPSGTELQIERIYIRKGQDEFDSITFLVPNTFVTIDHKEYTWPKKTIQHHNGPYQQDDRSGQPLSVTVKPKKRPLRFWVKLDDANNIEFSKV